MKKSNFKNQGRQALNKLLGSKREELRQLRFDLTTDKLKNYRQIRHLRKEIARISTVLNLQPKT